MGVREPQGSLPRSRKSRRGAHAERRVLTDNTTRTWILPARGSGTGSGSKMTIDRLRTSSTYKPSSARASQAAGVGSSSRAADGLTRCRRRTRAGGMGKTFAGRTSRLLTTRSLLFTTYLQTGDREDQPRHAPFSIAKLLAQRYALTRRSG